MLFFQQFYFVAIRIIYESHLTTRGKYFPPAGGPDLDAIFFELIAKGDEIRNRNSYVHEVFRYLQVVIGGPCEFIGVLVAGQFEMGDVIAGWGFICAALDHKAEVRAVPVGRSIEVTDADSSVKENVLLPLFWASKVMES